MTSGAQNQMANDTQLVLGEEEAVELLTFLVAAARTQLDDPYRYGSMRLLTAAEKLRDAVMPRCSQPLRDMMGETVAMSEHAQLSIKEIEKYTAAIDALNEVVARYVVESSDLSGS